MELGSGPVAVTEAEVARDVDSDELTEWQEVGCIWIIFTAEGLFDCHFLPPSGNLVWYCNLKNTLSEQQLNTTPCSFEVCRSQNSVSSSVSKSRSVPTSVDGASVCACEMRELYGKNMILQNNFFKCSSSYSPLYIPTMGSKIE